MEKGINKVTAWFQVRRYLILISFIYHKRPATPNYLNFHLNTWGFPPNVTFPQIVLPTLQNIILTIDRLDYNENYHLLRKLKGSLKYYLIIIPIIILFFHLQ